MGIDVTGIISAISSIERYIQNTTVNWKLNGIKYVDECHKKLFIRCESKDAEHDDRKDKQNVEQMNELIIIKETKKQNK